MDWIKSEVLEQEQHLPGAAEVVMSDLKPESKDPALNQELLPEFAEIIKPEIKGKAVKEGFKDEIDSEECFKLEGYLREDDFEDVLLSESVSSVKLSRIHQCSDCPYQTAQLISLKRHRMRHTGEKPFSCDKCSYKATQKTHLKEHCKRVHGEKPLAFSCDECPYKTSDKLNLERHSIAHELGPRLNGLYQCPDCPYQTKHTSRIKRHRMIHSGEKPFSCTQCSYKASRKTHLTAHTKTHAEKSFSCSHCSFKTADASTIKSHKLNHVEKKVQLYSCSGCPFTSIMKSDLKKWELTVSAGEETVTGQYFCKGPECSQKLLSLKKQEKTRKKLELKRLRTPAAQTGLPGYSCNVCSFKTSTKGTMRDHKSAHWLTHICSYCTIGKTTFQKTIPGQHVEKVLYVCDVCSGDKN